MSFAIASGKGPLPRPQSYRSQGHRGTDEAICLYGQERTLTNLLLLLKQWFTPAEILKLVTYDNAQLLALSGPRSPYQGELGIVKEGALADLLLVDGDPLSNIDLIGDPGKDFTVIMKNGVIYKGAR